MRIPIGIGVGAAVLALIGGAAGAKPAAKPAPPSAASAERHGVAASEHAPASGRGYSAQARHIADCLATYRDSYDPHTDKVTLHGGPARPCGL